MDVSDLHTWWEVPSIAHFFSLFSETFGLVDFDIEELEKWLIDAGTDTGSPFLIDLLCKVMKGCYNNKRSITHANFEFHFRDLIKKRWELAEGKVNPFYENDMNFKKLPVRTKVEMIQSLCDYRLMADDVTDKLKYFETDDLRKVPVGRDSTGALYWYFYGTRLYREVPDVKHVYTTTHDEKEVKSKRGRRKKEDIQIMENQQLASLKRGSPGKAGSDGSPLSGRRRGRKPRRLEEIQSQESDSSPASSPARRRGRPMRRGRPPQLRLEAVVQSDPDSTLTSASTTIMGCRASISPPKLTPQVSADSLPSSDTESGSASAHKVEPVATTALKINNPSASGHCSNRQETVTAESMDIIDMCTKKHHRAETESEASAIAPVKEASETVAKQTIKDSVKAGETESNVVSEEIRTKGPKSSEQKTVAKGKKKPKTNKNSVSLKKVTKGKTETELKSESKSEVKVENETESGNMEVDTYTEKQTDCEKDTKVEPNKESSKRQSEESGMDVKKQNGGSVGTALQQHGMNTEADKNRIGTVPDTSSKVEKAKSGNLESDVKEGNDTKRDTAMSELKSNEMSKFKPSAMSKATPMKSDNVDSQVLTRHPVQKADKVEKHVQNFKTNVKVQSTDSSAIVSETSRSSSSSCTVQGKNTEICKQKEKVNDKTNASSQSKQTVPLPATQSVVKEGVKVSKELGQGHDKDKTNASSQSKQTVALPATQSVIKEGVKVSKESGHGHDKESKSLHIVEKKSPPTAMAVQSKRGLKPRKKGLKSVEAIVSKLKTENIANSGQALDICGTTSRSDVGGASKVVKSSVIMTAEPPQQLCTESEERGIRITSGRVSTGNFVGKDDNMVSSKPTKEENAGKPSSDERLGEKQSQSSSEQKRSEENVKEMSKNLSDKKQSDKDSTRVVSEGHTVAVAEDKPAKSEVKKQDTEQKDEQESERSRVTDTTPGDPGTSKVVECVKQREIVKSGEVPMELSETEDLNTKSPHDFSKVSADSSTKSVEKDLSSTATKVSSSSEAQGPNQSQLKPVEATSSLHVRSDPKETVSNSAYNNDEPLDLSQKPSKSRSASPALVCNGVVEEKANDKPNRSSTSKCVESPLNLSRQHSKEEQAKSAKPSMSQLDGVWDSSDSEQELTCCVCTCNKEGFEPQSPRSRVQYTTRCRSCGRSPSKTIEFLRLRSYEQLDGVTDPVGDKDSSDPGGGVNSLGSSTNTETNTDQGMIISTENTTMTINDNAVESPCIQENEPHESDYNTVEDEEPLFKIASVYNASHESFSENTETVESSLQESVDEIQGSLVTGESLQKEDSGDNVIEASEEEEILFEESGDCSIDNASNPGKKTSVVNTIEEDDELCLFEMECEDVDGDCSEDTSCNKIIIPNVCSRSKRVSSSIEQVPTKTKASKKQPVGFVDLTCGSDNEDDDVITVIPGNNTAQKINVVTENVSQKKVKESEPSTSSNKVSITANKALIPPTPLASSPSVKKETSGTSILVPTVPKVEPQVSGLTRIEKEYLKLPKPAANVTKKVEVPIKCKSFTDSFTEFIAKQDKSQTYETSSLQQCPNNVRTKPAVEFTPGRDNRRLSSGSNNASRGQRSKRSQSSEEEEEDDDMTEDMDSQLEEDSELEIPKNKDGDYMPPIVLKTESSKKVARDSRKADIDLDDTGPLRRSSRRASKKIDYTVDLEPSSPSAEEEWLSSPPASVQSEAEPVDIKQESETGDSKSTGKSSNSESEGEQMEEGRDRDVKEESEIEQIQPKKKVKEEKEMAYDSNTESEGEYNFAMTSIKPLNETRQNNPKRRKTWKTEMYETDGSSDYIISDFNDSDEDFIVASKRGRGKRGGRGTKKRGRGRGLKQTIDYICAQLDGQNDNITSSSSNESSHHDSSSSDTDLDAPLVRSVKKKKDKGLKESQGGEVVEKEGEEGISEGRKTRSETRKTTPNEKKNVKPKKASPASSDRKKQKSSSVLEASSDTSPEKEGRQAKRIVGKKEKPSKTIEMKEEHKSEIVFQADNKTGDNKDDGNEKESVEKLEKKGHSSCDKDTEMDVKGKITEPEKKEVDEKATVSKTQEKNKEEDDDKSDRENDTKKGEQNQTDQENQSEKETSPEPQKKPRRSRARKTAAATLLPVRSSPRKSSAAKSIIDRLKEEEMVAYTSSDTEGYSEPAAAKMKSKRRGRPKLSDLCESEEGEGGVASDGTEDYWSEEEENLKVDDRVKAEFDEDFMKKQGRKWSLVCNHLDDWKCLAKRFKESGVKCEKQLYACLMQEFLPELPRLYSYKDEQIMGRARELAKLKEKIRRQSLGDGDTETSSDEEGGRLSDEVKREQFFKWQKEEEEREINRERERLKKDRAKRARNRELRAEGRTDAESENEAEDETEEDEQEEEVSDRKLRSCQRRRGQISKTIESRSLDEVTVKSLTKVLKTVQDQEDSWIFMDQVEEEYAPNYYEIIEEAMWLGRIEEKLDSGLYQAVEEFEADFQLMWDNCDEYNGSDSEYTEVSKTLDKVFKKALKKHLPRYSSNSSSSLDIGQQSPGRQKPGSPMRGSSKRGHQDSDSQRARAKRNASSQALKAMKYAEMSSDEFDEEEDGTRGLSGEEPGFGREDTGPSLGKKRKRAEGHSATEGTPRKDKNKAGLKVAPAPEKCGEGGPLDMVEIQKVDRDQFGGVLPPFGQPGMGSSGQMIGGPGAGQWGPNGGHPPGHMRPQGCYNAGMNYMGGAAGPGGAQYMDSMQPPGGDMRPQNPMHARMASAAGMRGPNAPPHRGGYPPPPPHMANPAANASSQQQQQYGHYPSMHPGGQFGGQRPPPHMGGPGGNAMPPPGYGGYNRQMNPMMANPQQTNSNHMPPQGQNPAGMMQRPSPGMGGGSGGEAANTSMHSSLGSPTPSDRVLSPKSAASPALSQGGRSVKVCSPNFPPRSPGLRPEGEQVGSPCMNSPRSDTPGSMNQSAGFPGSPGMRLASPGIPGMAPPHHSTSKREPAMGSPPQHMPPPSSHPPHHHHMGGFPPRGGVPPHMMEYGSRPTSPMMRPGNMPDRYPSHQHPAGYPGSQRFPGSSPHMNMYDPRGGVPPGSAMNRMNVPRGPSGYPPANQQAASREPFSHPGSFTSLLQELGEDMPPPVAPVSSATSMDGFSEMAAKQNMQNMDSPANSTTSPMGPSPGAPPPSTYRYGGDMQHPNHITSPNHNNSPYSSSSNSSANQMGSQPGIFSSSGSQPSGVISSPPQHSAASSQGGPVNSDSVAAMVSGAQTITSSKTPESATNPASDNTDKLQGTVDSTGDKNEGREKSGEKETLSSANDNKSSDTQQTDTENTEAKDPAADSLGKTDFKVEDSVSKPSDKVVENSSLMADLLSQDYTGNTKVKESNIPTPDKIPQNPDMGNPESSGKIMSPPPQQVGSVPTTTVTESQNLGGNTMTSVSSMGGMEGYPPFRQPNPGGPMSDMRGRAPPSQWGPYGSRSMQGGPAGPRMPGQMHPAGYPPRMPEGYMPRRNMDPNSSQRNMLSPGPPRGFGDRMPGPEAGYTGMPGMGPGKEPKAGDTSNVNQMGVPPQTSMASSVPVTAGGFWNQTPGENGPPYQSSKSDGNPSPWNPRPDSAPQSGIPPDSMPQRAQYPAGFMGNMPPDGVQQPGQAMKYPGNPMGTPQAPMPGHPGGPSPMGFNPNAPQYNQGMHAPPNQRMFSPQPHGQFSPSSDISGHSNTLSGDPGRVEEMEEEEIVPKTKKGKGKGKAKPAAKKKASKKEAAALDQMFQEPPEKKSKTKKSKKKKTEQIEESSNDSDLFMPPMAGGQKPSHGFLQQPPPFGNQGHPFMAGPNQMPNNNKLPFGHPGHPMSSYNMPPSRPRQQTPSGSLAGMMNMVNQMPVPDQESLVAGMRADAQQGGGFMGGEMGNMPPMPGMYPDGMNNPGSYPPPQQQQQMPPGGGPQQFPETADYMRRFPHGQQQPFRMHGNPQQPVVSKPDMFMEQSQRQMMMMNSSAQPQEVPIAQSVPNASGGSNSSSRMSPPDSSQASTMFSESQPPPPHSMAFPTNSATGTSSSSSAMSPALSSSVNQSQPMASVSRDSSLSSSSAISSSELPQQPVPTSGSTASPSSSLQSTAESCSQASHTAIPSSTESQTPRQDQRATSESKISETKDTSSPKLDFPSNSLKSKEENTRKELLSSDTNPSLMLTPPESPKSAGCSTGKVTETGPQVQSTGPTVSERTSTHTESGVKPSLNQEPQNTVTQASSSANEGENIDNSLYKNNPGDNGKPGTSPQDSEKPPISDPSQNPSNHMDTSSSSLSRPDSANAFKTPLGSPFHQQQHPQQAPSDMQMAQRQQPPGFGHPRPSLESMKMMPSGMGTPAMGPPGMQGGGGGGGGYMSQYYSQSSSAGGPPGVSSSSNSSNSQHHQQQQAAAAAAAMMMSGHSDMARLHHPQHASYMMQQQQQHYQHQQQQAMMGGGPGGAGMHNRMSMAHHMMHPGMQQSQMMYSYMQQSGQMGGQMMGSHMMQSHGASSPLQPSSSTSSPGPQYQQL